MYCRTNPPHPKANAKGLYPLHRVVAENKLGRSLLKSEEVHHKDEDKSNNHPDNLEVLSKSEHARLHNPPIPPIQMVCPKCGGTFELKPCHYRVRLRRSKTKLIHCSTSCTSKPRK